MKSFFRSRPAVVVFAVVIVTHVVLGIAMFGPSTSANLSDLPAAMLDADEGELGTQLRAADIELIEWQSIDSEKELSELLEDKSVAAGLVIPEGASEALPALAGEQPEPVTLELIVNVGRHAQAAQAAETALRALVDGVAAQISTQTLAGLTEAGVAVDTEAVPVLAGPVQLDVTYVNAPASPTAAQTPLVLVAMLWIGSLLAVLISYLSLHRRDITPTGFIGAQLIVAAGLAILQPLSILAVGTWILGLDITLTWTMFGVLALTTVMFFLIQSSILNLRGFAGWPILLLLWLFTFTLLPVSVEALATGYRVFIHSWLPTRFPHEALQGILFFDGAGRASQMIWISAAIAVGALILLLVSYARLSRIDLTVNPLAKRLATTLPTDDTGRSDEPSSDRAGGDSFRPDMHGQPRRR